MRECNKDRKGDVAARSGFVPLCVTERSNRLFVGGRLLLFIFQAKPDDANKK